VAVCNRHGARCREFTQQERISCVYVVVLRAPEALVSLCPFLHRDDDNDGIVHFGLAPEGRLNYLLLNGGLSDFKLNLGPCVFAFLKTQVIEINGASEMKKK